MTDEEALAFFLNGIVRDDVPPPPPAHEGSGGTITLDMLDKLFDDLWHQRVTFPPMEEIMSASAVAEHLRRDALWACPPPLAGDCEHDLRLLPLIEFRVTVYCMKCGGLDVETSREMTTSGASFSLREDGSFTRNIDAGGGDGERQAEAGDPRPDGRDRDEVHRGDAGA